MSNDSQSSHDAPIPIRIVSAEDPENERLVAAEGYRPHYVAAPTVVDDDLHDTEPIPAWREYLASGSSRPLWFLIDPLGKAHFVEPLGLGEDYVACGPGYRSRFENAYDAFWTAEKRAGLFTEPVAWQHQGSGCKNTGLPKQRSAGGSPQAHREDLRLPADVEAGPGWHGVHLRSRPCRIRRFGIRRL